MKKTDMFDFVDVVWEIIHDSKDEQEIDTKSKGLITLILNQVEISKELLAFKRKDV